jgi:Concanavalin A-like lectin/glucanases superfamily
MLDIITTRKSSSLVGSATSSLWSPRSKEAPRVECAPLGLGLGFGRPPKILGAPFTPLSLAGCVCWLRADLGITGSTTVSGWADQSGNGNNASQVTTARQPTYAATGGSNSTPCLQFTTATQQWMQITDAASLRPTTQTVMAVAEFTSTSNQYQQLFTRSTSSAETDGWGIGMNGGTGTNAVGYWASAYTRAANLTLVNLNTWHMLVGVYDGAHNMTYEDGNAPVLFTYAGGITYPSTTNTLIGAYFTSGSATPEEFLAGAIGELAMWNRALSSAEVGLLHTYCVARYATP